MSGPNWKLTPKNGYDIPALEGWLEERAAAGLRFSMTVGPVTLFQRAEPERVQIHLEPIRGAAEEDPELTALYAAAGWAYQGIFRGSYFVFSTRDLQAQAHTDPETLDCALRRFFRQKLAVGAGLLLLSFLLPALYWPDGFGGAWSLLRWFPLESIFRYRLIPFTLSAAGLALVDLSYLLGMVRLWKYRRAVRTGKSPSGKRRAGGGWLLAAGILLLLPVGAELTAGFFGLDYTPYPLEGSGFVTLAELEGPDFPITGDRMYNMDHISHSDTPLTPERWYFRQYGAFAHFDGDVALNKVPHLELQINRWLLPSLARQQMDEWSRVHDVSYSLADYEGLPAGLALDEGLISRGETGMTLLLRRGSTVLQAEYRGDKDLTDYLERFAQLLGDL